MNLTYQTAARGLSFMFWGSIVALGGIIPLLGFLFSLAGGIMALYGIWTAAKAHSNYRSALYTTLVGIVVSLLVNFFGDGVFGAILGILESILSLATTYFVCMASAELLTGVDNRLVSRANKVWMLYLVCTIATVLCQVIALFASVLAGILLGIVAIVALVASILYLVFLYQAKNVLRQI